MSIVLEDISKKVGDEVHIYPLNLSLEQGAFNVLLGTTRAGKTTLMRLMAGLDRPSTGRILSNGKDVTRVSVRRRNVAMVYQQFINYPNMSVYENIASPLKVSGLKSSDIKHRVHAISELLRLTPMLNRRPHELSGGQQQRTALARALVKDAELVLLDEPLANLDYKLREELREELPALLANKGATVVYATSEPGEALLLAGTTATLHQGRVTQFGATSDVYRRPLDLVSAQTFSDPPLNVAKAIKRGDQMSLAGIVQWTASGAAAQLPDGEYTIAVRAYHITPTPRSTQALRVEARVLVAELSGSESIVHVEVAGQTWVSLSRGVHALEVGAKEGLYLQASEFLYFSPNGTLLVAPDAANQSSVRP